MFNYAQGAYENPKGEALISDNPESHTKAWNREERGQNIIRKSELRPWFEAVKFLSEEGNEFDKTAGEYLVFVLMNGLRRREAAMLRIEDISFNDRSLTIWKTKKSKPITLPMSEFIYQLLICSGQVFP